MKKLKTKYEQIYALFKHLINVLLRYHCNCENSCSKDAVCPSVSSTPGCGNIRNITTIDTSTVSNEEIVTTACKPTSKQNYTTVGPSSTLEPETTPEALTTDVTSELSNDSTVTLATSPTTTATYPTTDESTSAATQRSSTEASTSTSSLSISSSSFIKSTQSDIPTPPSDINTEGSTPRELFPVDSSDPMEYWPIIVGSILGGLALIALIGFLVFYRRYQKARWRQDIYNVNPKILHRLEENGTTGRSDVALETEPV
ncbi:hypothetical protein CHS0354_026120 [Potamilus streckersoni]|uniref:Uncharacterized protein n=1 Tax=Potamilus streckersoni TaxID=2493646 RepID=A0AAE0S1A2_9BIVA|nr:hypothetical protein CHS0354_026120 [Potamilus streckersoni]